jgi:urease accessory protein
MLVVDRVVGNRSEDADLDAACAVAAAGGRLEVVRLGHQDSLRRRLRVATDAGTELGIDLGQQSALRDGDVLYRSPDGAQVVMLSVESPQAVVITPLSPTDEPMALFELGVRLGHALGNQHWPLQVANGQVEVPVTTDPAAVETVLKTHRLAGLVWELVEQGRDG